MYRQHLWDFDVADARRLQAFQKDRKLTQMQLASGMGISQASVSEMLRSRREIYVDKIDENGRIEWFEVKRRAAV